MVGYIYAIANRINNDTYIGQTVNAKKRHKQHFRELRINKHVNENLQDAFNQYGEKNFKFIIIEKCNIDDLTEREQFWINYYINHNFRLYNIKLHATDSRYKRKNKVDKQIQVYFIILTVIGFFVYVFHAIALMKNIKFNKHVYCIIVFGILILVFLWTFNYFGVI